MNDERFLRHSLIDWLDQDELARMSVIIVGAGAVGNEVIKDLALLGVGHFHIIDFDLVEIHNLTRNVLFNEAQIGRHKAEIAALTGEHLGPGSKFTWSPADFWDCLSLKEIRAADAVFCCVDNFAARLRLNKLCLIAETDLYNAAIDSRSVAVEAYPFSTDPESSCYECQLPASVYARLNERYSCGWLKKRGFEEKKVPTTILTASLAGSTVCSAFLHRHRRDAIQEGARAMAGAFRLFFDTISFHSSIVSLDRNPECPACSAVLPSRHVFRTSNKVGSLTPEGYSPLPDLRLKFSDQLVLETNCLVCGVREEIFDRADRFDDSLALCPACGARSRDIVFADEMDITSLEENYRGKKLPVKYVFFEDANQQFYIELEDNHD